MSFLNNLFFMLDFSLFFCLQNIFMFHTQRSNCICSIFIYFSHFLYWLNYPSLLLSDLFSFTWNVSRQLILYLLHFLYLLFITCLHYCFSLIDWARIYITLSYFRRAIYKVRKFLCFYVSINLILLFRSLYYSFARFMVSWI